MDSLDHNELISYDFWINIITHINSLYALAYSRVSKEHVCSIQSKNDVCRLISTGDGGRIYV